MVDKLAEIRLRRLHEVGDASSLVVAALCPCLTPACVQFLRAPESAKTLFMEEAKPSARRDHPTVCRLIDSCYLRNRLPWF